MPQSLNEILKRFSNAKNVNLTNEEEMAILSDKAITDELKKIKKTSQSKEEKLYQKILDNPNISSKSKTHLKRNTKNGSILDYDQLKAFEKNEIAMNEDWSDEETTTDKLRKLTKAELDEIKELEIMKEKFHNKMKTSKSIPKLNEYTNKRAEYDVKINTIKAQPKIEFELKRLKKLHKKGKIDDKEYKDMVYGTKQTLGISQYDLKVQNQSRDNLFEINRERIYKLNNGLQDYATKSGRDFNQSKYNEINNLISDLKVDEAEELLKELTETKSNYNFTKDNKKIKQIDDDITKRNKEIEKEFKSLSLGISQI